MTSCLMEVCAYTVSRRFQVGAPPTSLHPGVRARQLPMLSLGLPCAQLPGKQDEGPRWHLLLHNFRNIVI